MRSADHREKGWGGGGMVNYVSLSEMGYVVGARVQVSKKANKDKYPILHGLCYEGGRRSP